MKFVALLGSLVILGGCFGAYQVSPDNVRTVGGLTPNVEDKDAGLVALAPGFDIKTYKVIAVDKFPVTDPAIKDEDDRRKAAEISTILQNELVRRLRDTGLFSRVVNLTETEFRPGSDKRPFGWRASSRVSGEARRRRAHWPASTALAPRGPRPR